METDHSTCTKTQETSNLINVFVRKGSLEAIVSFNYFYFTQNLTTQSFSLSIETIHIFCEGRGGRKLTKQKLKVRLPKHLLQLRRYHAQLSLVLKQEI